MIILSVLLPCLVFSQTNISGVINSYYKVIEIIPQKSCIRVDNPSGLGYNDQVMIVQMKGLAVNTTNSSAFGSTVSVNNAGRYEVATVCWIKLDSVFLFKELAQSYTVADKVQLVRIPQYESAIVTDSLKAAPWDNTTGKGGILALTVYDQLILSAPISAIGSGFRGGQYATSNATCSNLTAPGGYFYNASSLAPQSGAYKGEAATELAVGYSGGKGAVANGGGGGNNHNNGGGGGGHMGAGGAGGGNSSASGCNVSNPGIGGYALSSDNGSRIFFGGGGGAGHANSGLPSSGGGRGGGIVFIHANTIYNNGFKILASGQKGGSTTGDGASGGGGGGTILLDINNYVGALNADASGGIGGTESDDNTSQKCYGEGGGGGGGVIYMKGSAPLSGTTNVSGGPKGVKQFYLNCGPLVAAAPGASGQVISNYTYIQSATISTYCEVVLPVHLEQFQVIQDDADVKIEWTVADAADLKVFHLQRRKDGDSWNDIADIPATLLAKDYSYTDKQPAAGSYQYRLRVVEQNGRDAFSMIRGIRIRSANTRIILYPNPASGSVNMVYPLEKNMDIRIFDVMGKLMITRKVITREVLSRLDISTLPKGIYYVRINEQAAPLVVK